MRRIVAVCCFVALCAGIVLASVSIGPVRANAAAEMPRPVAQADAGAGYLMELSTMGLLGAGVISLLVCRRRKHL